MEDVCKQSVLSRIKGYICVSCIYVERVQYDYAV